MHTTRTASILVVAGEDKIRFGITESLKKRGHRVDCALDSQDVVERNAKFSFDLVITDLTLRTSDGLELVEWTVKKHPETTVIILTSHGTFDAAVEAMRKGAHEYLTKPVVDEELELVIQRTLKHREIEDENRTLRAQLGKQKSLSKIIGSDDRMTKMFAVIESVADTRTTILISGESGTGKSMTARAIHQLSHRREKPFIELSCGTLPATLLEADLFGSETDSTSGAPFDMPGKLLRADGGTLFLNEISAASPSLQAKLLHLLQTREFESVGGNQSHHVDVRMILATNQDLEAMVERGEFRQDLFDRINVITIDQPSLRERSGDIPLLVDHYIRVFNDKNHKQVEGISEEALSVMQRYEWPGNVRELVNITERAVVLARSSLITITDLPEAIRENRSYRPPSAEDLENCSLKEALANPERHLIIEALDANGWNRQKTAEALGINRTTLYKKMKKYNIRYELEHNFK
ncbi:MAG: sigma-54-dependent Fis family transcriptional regulator [Planctomycetaceae bacterium]|nr:sigma-54-dependent Fis family transcriptional regulator [Planctomycetaceae bacterium]